MTRKQWQIIDFALDAIRLDEDDYLSGTKWTSKDLDELQDEIRQQQQKRSFADIRNDLKRRQRKVARSRRVDGPDEGDQFSIY